MDTATIDTVFPFQAYRDGQKEAIEEILNAFESGKKYAVLEGPCGSGKSAMAKAIAGLYKPAYWLSSQKVLQDQIMGDFGTDRGLIDLKGRSNYPCNYWDTVDKLDKDSKEYQKIMEEKSRKKGAKWLRRDLNCNEGVCKLRDARSRCDVCVPSEEGTILGEFNCPYWNQVDLAQKSELCLMNFKSFLYQTAVADRFMPRKLMIIDECFHPHTMIETNKGRLPIGKIVNQNLDCQVLSYNDKTGKLEYKKIKRYLRRSKQKTYRVLAGNKIMYPTLDHKIFTPKGKKKLSDLKIGNKVYINEPEVSHVQKQVLLGSLLGDSSAQIVPSKRKSASYVKKGTRARVRMQHGPNQSNYLDWKYLLIKEHTNQKPRIVSNKGFGNKLKKLSTKCNLYDHIKVAFDGNHKVINKAWLNQINELGLAIWFMDDGSNSNNCIRFNTQGFTYKENLRIIQWLSRKFSINAKIKFETPSKGGQKYCYISLNRENSRKLAAKIAKYIIPSMRYKLPEGNWDCYDESIEKHRSKPISAQPILKIEEYKTTITYDLEVEGNHNYFAGATLVSNCHNLESEILDFVSLTLSDRHFKRDGIKFPDLKDTAAYADYFRDIGLDEKIDQKIKAAHYLGNMAEKDEWESAKMKLNLFLKYAHGGTWVHEFKDKGPWVILEFKPIFVDNFVHQYVFQYAEKVLMMSATVLSPTVMYRALGIDSDVCHGYRMKNRFPAQNRPIVFIPVGSLNYRNKKATFPKMIREVDRICTRHKDHRGMIHSHNFEIAELLISKCKNRDRFLYQKDFDNKQEMLEEHAKRPNSVIVAPAMHEGLDLKEDLARFQVIAKVPYPSFVENKQLKYRMELDGDYYLWLTALKLYQSTGRAVRSETDWAITYILDSEFRNFHRRSKKMTPGWFSEALQEAR